MILFLDNNKTLFISAVVIFFIIQVFIFVLFIIMCIRFMEGKYNILWPVSILRIALPIICKTFCGQIFVLLLSTFKCIHSDILYYAAVVECDTGTWYYFILTLGCISLIIQIILYTNNFVLCDNIFILSLRFCL